MKQLRGSKTGLGPAVERSAMGTSLFGIGLSFMTV